MKRFTTLFSLFLLLSIGTTAWADTASPTAYETTEVTDLANLLTDKEYIIALADETATNRYLLEDQHGAWIESAAQTGRYPLWTLEISGGKYAFKSETGYYLGTTFADNRIARSDAAIYFEVTAGGDGFTFKNVNGGDNNGSYVSINTTYNWNTAYSTSVQTEWKFYEVTGASSIITSIDQFSNTETYTIKSARGYMIYAPDYILTHPWCSGNAHYSYPTSDPVDATDANNQWAVLLSPNTGNRYLYNVGAQQFLLDGGNFAIFSTTPNATGVFSLLSSTVANKNEYPLVCVVGSDQLNMNTDAQNSYSIYANWNRTGDIGNAVCIESVSTGFDPTAALAKIQEYEAASMSFETSTHDSPKYYAIKAKRGDNGGDQKGYYLSYNGDDGVLQRTAVPTTMGLWYFVEDGEGVKIYNHATNKALASNSSFTDEGITWYTSANSTKFGYWNISTAQTPTGGDCFDANNTNNGVGYWDANTDGTAWTFEAITISEAQLAMTPEFTTDLSKPVYYRIKSIRSGNYAAHNGDAAQLIQTADTSGDNTLWYFTAAATDGTNYNPETGAILHNAATTNCLATNSSFTAEGAKWYVVPNPYNTGGYTITLSRDLGSTDCWDDQGSGSKIGYWAPSSSDNQGTTWVLEKATASAEAIASAVAGAEDALSKTGVGYPAAGSSARSTLQTALDNFKAITEPQFADLYELTAATSTYKASTDIQMPEDGKAYYISSVQPADDFYFYMDESGLALSDTKVETAAGVFVCRVMEDGTYVFVNGNGDYLVHKSNSGGFNSNSGKTTDYDAAACKFYLHSGNGISHDKAFGSISIYGNVTGVAGAKYSGFTVSPEKAFNKYSRILGEEDPYLAIEDGWSTMQRLEEVAAYIVNAPALNDASALAEESVKAISTFSAPYATVAPAGVSAYYVKETVTASGDELAVMTAVEAGKAIPANTGVVLTSTASGRFTMVPATTEEQADLSGNLLVAADGTAIADDVNAFVLSQKDGVIAFYVLNDTDRVVAAGKAYLVLSNAMPSVKMSFGGNATGIESVETEINTNAPIYDLSGRRVQSAVKGGVYIQNGKKFIVK